MVSLTNLNRQLIATRKPGQTQVEVMRERILEINPEAEVTIHQAFICRIPHLNCFRMTMIILWTQ